MNSGSCVAAVKPHLDSDASIDSWSVDTNDPNKTLTVEGTHLSDSEIQRHVSEAGFKVLGKVDSQATPGETESETPKLN